jgi:hypothetical protein
MTSGFPARNREFLEAAFYEGQVLRVSSYFMDWFETGGGKGSA